MPFGVVAAPATGAQGSDNVEKRQAMSRYTWIVLTAALVGSVSAVSGQSLDDGGASPYFDCPYVNYFDTDCPQLREQRPQARGRQAQERQAEPEPRPGPGRSDEPGNNEDGPGDPPRGVLPDELILFPRESLAPDAPPLFRILLAQPTLANARRYVRWHARRTAQLQVVQALIQRAGRELETNPGLALGPVERSDQAGMPDVR